MGSGASISLIRFYLLYKDDAEKQKQAASNSFLIGITGSLFLITVLAILFFTSLKNYCDKYAVFTVWAMISFTFFSLLLTYARTKEWLISYALLSAFQSAATSLLIVIGIYYGYGIDSFFVATAITLTFLALPFFFLFKHYHTFSWPLLKEQLSYSLPLLIYSLLYACFFTIDRFILRYYGGYELLGSYAILWKFGALFQFYAVALIDASPVIFYNAQKEPQSEQLLSKCILYFIVALAIGCLVCLGSSFIMVDLIIPYHYRFIKEYMSLFFFSLFLIECARVVQCGIGLSMKTMYAPLNVCLTLSIQIIFLALFSSLRIWGILIANTISFFFYIILSYYTTARLYSHRILNQKTLCILIGFFVISTGYLHSTRNSTLVIHIITLIVISVLWSILFLYYVCDEYDKELLKQYVKNFNLKNRLKIAYKK